jgi:hypothetical protein
VSNGAAQLRAWSCEREISGEGPGREVKKPG